MKKLITNSQAQLLKPAAAVLGSAALLAGGYALIQSAQEQKTTQQSVQMATSANMKIKPVLPIMPIEDQLFTFSENPHEQCRANNLPSYINVSMTWGPSNFMLGLRGYKALSPPSVIVTTAGNAANDNPPRPLLSENKKRGSQEFDAILVGSITPHGHKSSFSQKGEEVAIMAPSNYELTTANKAGEYKKFSGTSGATPLVTGALAGFSWLSGYQPTGAEAKLLLTKTAIPLRLSNEDPRLNGPGMLNSYKLGMVGKRLRELCGTDPNCFKTKIKENATYQFPEDPDLQEAVERAFPECNADRCLERSNDCSDKAAVFKHLRKAAFLNPSKKELWRSLACIYAAAGFDKNAKGMQNIYDGLSGAPPAESPAERTNNHANTSCTKDEDCILASYCSKKPNNTYYDIFLQPVNKDYVPHCQGLVLCNGKCRCDSEEGGSVKVDDKYIYSRSWTSRCVNAECVAVKAGEGAGSGSR